MPRLPYFVIADDLTGAAELAALAHRAGFRAVVLTEAPRRAIDADVIVCDSDSRLDTPAVAARKVRQLAHRLSGLPNAGLFKKVDSVLRGNVVAEIEACLGALGLERALLVPCNPSLGRIINNGRYFVAGQPLDRTPFRRDPHHPRTSSVVTKLLAGTEGCFHTADQLPDYGIIVGEASSPADVALWASRLDAPMLPAGGADFFRGWLMQKRAARRVPASQPPVVTAQLMLSGTATPSDPVTPIPGPCMKLDPAALPTPATLATLAAQQLRDAGAMSIYLDRPSPRRKASPAAINRTFSQLVRRLSRTRAFDHALLTGGTTASCVFAELGWHRFEVVHVWGPGVVTLRPADAPRFLVTVKPGSYAWPVAMRRHFSVPA